MRVATAMLPDAASSQDRVFVTDTAVIVLDGASAFVPVDVSPSTYVDTLGSFLVEGLAAEPRIQLADLLARAIENSAALLGLVPGASPSSTVAIARQQGEYVDLLALGDSLIVTPQAACIDNRISLLADGPRQEYRSRLVLGGGYDEGHRELLRSLQLEQARHRNVAGGYWIAEAVPGAARHARSRRARVDRTPWLVLATDGAYRPIEYLGIDWEDVARQGDSELAGLLKKLKKWEREIDPDGRALPRAKRHDDKTIGCITW